MFKPVFVWMFLLFFVVGTVDGLIVYTSYNNFHNALDLALDAGLIAGVQSDDSQRGRLFIDEAKGYIAARDELQRNLKLDGNLSNTLYENSSFSFSIDAQGNRPIAKGEFKTRVKIHMGRILGIDSIPIGVSKESEFVNSYI